jgi:hypothetical protein
MKRAVLFARVLRLLRNLGAATVSGDRFPAVRRTLHRLLQLKLNETQVLLLSGLVVGVGAGRDHSKTGAGSAIVFLCQTGNIS